MTDIALLPFPLKQISMIVQIISVRTTGRAQTEWTDSTAAAHRDLMEQSVKKVTTAKRIYFLTYGFLISNFHEQDKMQLLAKFTKILFTGFRAALKFWKFKAALNPMYRIFKLCQKLRLMILIKC